jgi:hypothetical protein
VGFEFEDNAWEVSLTRAHAEELHGRREVSLTRAHAEELHRRLDEMLTPTTTECVDAMCKDVGERLVKGKHRTNPVLDMVENDNDNEQ